MTNIPIGETSPWFIAATIAVVIVTCAVIVMVRKSKDKSNKFAIFTFDRPAEIGVALGLIVATVLMVLIRVSDWYALYNSVVRGVTPYSLFWVLINPLFWTDMPYKLFTMVVTFAGEGLMYWFFVRTGRIPKFMFYLGWLQTCVWMSGTVFQNVTVTLFAPLAAWNPLFALLIPLQKLPLFWSWIPWNNAHWQCAFAGTETFETYHYSFHGIVCPAASIRLDPTVSWFWSYAMVLFWFAYPTLWWILKRRRQKKLDGIYEAAHRDCVEPCCGSCPRIEQNV